jgi:hypothetical protein
MIVECQEGTAYDMVMSVDIPRVRQVQVSGLLYHKGMSPLPDIRTIRMYTPSPSWSNLLVSFLFLSPLASATPCSSCSTSPSTSSNSTILPYLNPHLCIQSRLDDLLSRMTLKEKAGQLFIKQIPAGINGTIDNTTFVLDGNRNLTTAPLITERLLSHSMSTTHCLQNKWLNGIMQSKP